MTPPKWHREMEIFQKVNPMLILEGNVLDIYQYPFDDGPGEGAALRLPEYLHHCLVSRGYGVVACFDNLRGFFSPCDEGMVDALARLTGVGARDGAIAAEFRGKSPASATSIAAAALCQAGSATALIFDFASRYVPSPDRLQQGDVDAFTSLMKTSLSSGEVSTEKGILKNLMIVLVNKANDLPAWFYHDNPNVKMLTLGTPDREEREALIRGERLRSFFHPDVYREDIPAYEGREEELMRLRERFVSLTDGLSFTELMSLMRLCRNERIRVKDMASVVDLFRYGIRENPWDNVDAAKLRDGNRIFRSRVKGQDAAIEKTLDIVKRAVAGMAGLQRASSSGPKGVLFFAGPTGTGKTETAKTLAELIFGDESAFVRFDMSEYAAAHSDQKLMGAPPGYVGYEAGGQLTNAVRKNPFTILLFDEIDKANVSIFDKFLQILEDGRMTDGQGRTVYFTECIIVFTSNIGIYTVGQDGRRHANVTMDMSYREVRQKVSGAVDDFFKLQLGRPELLNRIGENIVIFDYIRPGTAVEILDSQLARVKAALLEEKNIELSVSAQAFSQLGQLALENLENGGRGIGNVVESCFINPLARRLFDAGALRDARVRVEGVLVREGRAELELEMQSGPESGEG